MSTATREIARKLTSDWNREIKLDSGPSPICRYKGDLAAWRHHGYIQVSKSVQNFCTGSTYEGNYDSLGFAGLGEFVYPHGKYVVKRFIP
ncbi:hypothetical protein NQ314_002028 [Rhamnusium bicolor]|uniref:Uncharacterized protein n=1 Tax=Rhamnusium bicolor TaxID=1586634 RepID=A0AAV8ZSE5_9CUCU|nr:hypothetical protein NQ314_002028 [Rhamnusium bicolor]